LFVISVGTSGIWHWADSSLWLPNADSSRRFQPGTAFFLQKFKKYVSKILLAVSSERSNGEEM
jgi:hypothetical protein